MILYSRRKKIQDHSYLGNHFGNSKLSDSQHKNLGSIWIYFLKLVFKLNNKKIRLFDKLFLKII